VNGKMKKVTKAGIIVLLVVAVLGITLFSGSVMASSSGDEHRTSESQRLGDEHGMSSLEPERQRSEDRTRTEDI
jgi:hypothetical protein